MLCVQTEPRGFSHCSDKYTSSKERPGPPQTFGLSAVKDEAARQRNTFIKAGEDRRQRECEGGAQMAVQAENKTGQQQPRCQGHERRLSNKQSCPWAS